MINWNLNSKSVFHHVSGVKSVAVSLMVVLELCAGVIFESGLLTVVGLLRVMTVAASCIRSVHST